MVCDPVRTDDSGFEIDVLLTGASDGFTMTQNGDVANIGGTPALAGTCNVTCTVKDSHGNHADATAATIVVSAVTVSATAQVKPVAQTQNK